MSRAFTSKSETFSTSFVYISDEGETLRLTKVSGLPLR